MSQDQSVLHEKIEMLNAGIRCGRIHTIAIVGLGDETSEVYIGSDIDGEKESVTKIANLNLKMIGALHLIMDMVISNTFLDDAKDTAVSSSFKVVDDENER